MAVVRGGGDGNGSVSTGGLNGGGRSGLVGGDGSVIGLEGGVADFMRAGRGPAGSAGLIGLCRDGSACVPFIGFSSSIGACSTTGF